jgi:hypothetical protein
VPPSRSFLSVFIHHPVTHICRCKDGVDCHCSTAKKPGRPKTRDLGAFPPVSPMSATSASVPVSIHALRPVLPRPPVQQSCVDATASLAHPHPHNHRFSHGSAFFSPYGRAYEEHHYSSEEGFSENGLATHRSSDLMAWSSDSSGHSIPHKSYPPSFPELQDGLDSPEYPAGLRGFCTCGENCACPTCLQHRGPIAWSSREDCSNPVSCNGCLRISDVAPHPAPTPPTTPQDGRIPHQFEPLEEWIENMPMIPPSPPFDDVSKGYPMFDLPRIVEPMPITLESLPDVFHEPTSQCICVGDQRMRIGNYCMRCQRRCDDHEPGEDQSDLLANNFPNDRACCIPSNIPMLTVPPPRSRASSTSSIASDLSSLYPHSIEDTSGGATISLLPSLSRVRRMASDITSPLLGDGAGPTYAIVFPLVPSRPCASHRRILTTILMPTLYLCYIDLIIYQFCLVIILVLCCAVLGTASCTHYRQLYDFHVVVSTSNTCILGFSNVTDMGRNSGTLIIVFYKRLSWS